MVMVEIRAERNGRSLHNFSAFLAKTHEGQISELWMVEALPAYSDAFWQSPALGASIPLRRLTPD